MEKFLSIIIPVYNVEKYLAECLDSCLDQDIPHDDYEIICVNDGSTDGSGEVLERYDRAHLNIHVITQPNGGISSARNTGLDAACGEYIWFVDSDDFIQKNCLGDLRRALTEAPADRLIFCYYEFRDALSTAEREQAERNALPPVRAMQEITAWASLYRHAFLLEHDLRFLPELRFAEDGIFNHSFNRCAPVTAYQHSVLYFYRRNSGSLTQTLTHEAMQRRTDAYRIITLRLTDYARQDLNMLQETHAEHDQYIRTLMPLVREITILSASLPREPRRELLKKLSEAGLFPLFLYRKPRDWFPRSIHMNHSRVGLTARIVDILKFYSTTRLGFAVLVSYYKLYYKQKRKGQ